MKKHYLILCILIGMLLLIPTGGVFAADATNTALNDSLALDIVNKFIKIASWGWAIVAVIAGKLMSNDFIYASGLNLDTALFTMRNYIKNFANFTIGFVFVYKILKSLFTKDSFAIKSELPKFLLATIFANMSRFLMGALLDISNVLTAAVGSFPQTIIQDDGQLKQKMQALNVGIPDKICLDMNQRDMQSCVGSYQVQRDIDRIWARFNDMSGPLLFIGASIFRFQEYNLVNQDITNLQNFTIGTFIKLFLLLLYIAPLIALLIINVKRIFYVWLRIIFGPFIAIGETLGIKPSGKGLVANIFSIKEIIGLVFQPVFVIGGMALVLILSMGMYSVMGGTAGAGTNTSIVSTVLGSAEVVSSPGTSTFSNPSAGTEISYVGDIFKDIATFTGGLFGYLIITLFVILLLRAVVKMSTSSSEIASSTFKGVTDLAQSFATGMNIIPMGNAKVSLASMMNGGDMLKSGLQNRSNKEKAKGADNLQGIVYNSGLGKGLQKIYGEKAFSHSLNPDNDIGNQETANIKNLFNQNKGLHEFIDNIGDILRTSQKTNKKKQITLKNSDSFTTTIFDTISQSATMKKEISKELNIEEKEITKENLFGGTTNASKQFLYYLQSRLNGGSTKLNEAKIQDIDKNNFIFFGATASGTPETKPPTSSA